MAETRGAKTGSGNFFEDFSIGQRLRHATPRTATAGDVGLYQALYGSRFALQSASSFAQSLGFPASPLDDLLVFHLVFGKTVSDISLNAIANLGYAEGVFGVPVYPGDSLSSQSEVIGLKQTSAGDAGIVYVRTRGVNQRDEEVLSYVRWVLVRKRNPESPAPETLVPELAAAVPVERYQLPLGITFSDYDCELAGSPHRFDSYAEGERIDHIDGMTIEEAEHQMATRLYQNTARVHFNQHVEGQGRFGRRLVYGGHVISLARAISFNGLANAVKVLALNGGSHTAPCFAGDTLYAWSEVLEAQALPGRYDAGVLRLRTVATKDKACYGFPDRGGDGRRDAAVVLDLDYSVVIPR